MDPWTRHYARLTQEQRSAAQDERVQSELRSIWWPVCAILAAFLGGIAMMVFA